MLRPAHYIILVSYPGARDFSLEEAAAIERAAGRALSHQFSDFRFDEHTYVLTTWVREEAQRICDALERLEGCGLICNQLGIYSECPHNVLTKT